MDSWSNNMSRFEKLLASHEDWLIKRLNYHARRVIDIGDGASVEEAWRRCVRGLSGALIKGLKNRYPDFEFRQGEDFKHDPICAFILNTAIRHRERGISLEMFHALMIYYKQAWLDLVIYGEFEADYEAVCLKYVARMFDRMMVAFCAEWAETDQSKLIEELQASNRAMSREKDRYLTIFEGVPNPVFIVDEQNRIADLNLAASVLLNISGVQGAQYYLKTVTLSSNSQEDKETDYKNSGVLIGKPMIEIFPWLGYDLDKFIASRDSSVSIEKEILNQEGTRYFNIKFSRILDMREIFSGLIIIFEDITTQKQAAEELRLAKEAAEAASRAKSEFLSNMSHELRTPMNAILGYSQLMQRDIKITPQQREYTQIINRSGEHLLTLINEVLEIAKIEARKVHLNIATFNLHRLLHDLKSMFIIRTDVKRLQFKITGIDDIPMYIIADEHKLLQILINLIGNAVKFTEEGGITIQVSTEEESPKQIYLIFQVEDTGVGIAEDEQEKVFRYFEQTASGMKSQTGTGLGMAISRYYARMMGGDITFSSQYGRGTIFCFKTKISISREPNVSKSLKLRSVVGIAPGQTIPCILVAEDIKESRILLVRLLETVGFKVKEAADGKQAVEAFEKWQPDFIWMDIRMPVMNGLEATRCIKAKTSKTGKVPLIVALTAHALDEDREEIVAAGCDDLVHKPFRENDIFTTMAKHMGVKYIYKEEQAEEISVKADIELTPEQLDKLPKDLLDRLHNAATRLDMASSLTLIEEIAEQDAAIGNALRRLAKELEYDRLLRLLEMNDYGQA